MEATAKVAITPEMMAEAFWGMSDIEQARFFESLNGLVESQFLFECQAWGLGKQLSEGARNALMTISAPCYLNVLRATGVSV